MSWLKDKRVVLTGASAGIGEELALRLADRGARLVLGARRLEALEEVAGRCQQRGAPQALAQACDVSVQEDCQALVGRAVEAWGGVDLLINNAGVSMWGGFEELEDLDFFHTMMQVNYFGAVYCTRSALPCLRDSAGLLVAVSSLAGITGVPRRTGYAASKHAMQGFFDSLRIELLGTGVDVLVVSPGFVATDIRAQAFGPDGQPRGESPRHEDRETMSVERCVELMIDSIEARDRELIMTPEARLGRWIKLIAPGIIDRFTARKLREKDER